MVPNAVVPNAVTSNVVVPNDAAPNVVVPNAVARNVVVPNAVIPNAVVPNDAVSNAVVPLRLCHLKRFLDGERVWAPFLKFVSLMELQSWVKKKPRLGARHDNLECRKVLATLFQSGNS